MSGGHSTFTSHLASGLVATMTAAVLSYFVHGTRAMHLYGELNFDAWALSRADARSDLFIVAIDDESYFEDFGLASPLNQDKVQQVITAIASMGATVIGVDLDTRDWDPGLLGDLPASIREKIVWARLPLGDLRRSKPDRLARYTSLLALQPCGGSVFFGSSDAAHPEQGSVTGVVRTMPRSMDIDGVLAAPFGDLVTWVARDGANACREPRLVEPTSEYIRFLHRGDDGLPHVPIVSTRSVLTSGAGSLKGAIVLVGGTFADAADRVSTPFGPQHGIALHADVVHTRLAGSPCRAWGAPQYFVLDIALGLTIVTFAWLTRSHGGVFWFGLLCLVVGTFLGSLGAFQLTSRYLSVWPVLIGVSLHEAVERLAPRYWRSVWTDLAGLFRAPFKSRDAHGP